MSDPECLADFKFRSECRVEHPGLCAEEYETVLKLVIKHLVGWDDDLGSSNGEGGIFGKPEAYAVATEEQGRKTLHMHILVWIKNWNALLMRLLRRRNPESRDYKADVTTLKKFVQNAAVSTIHQDRVALNADPFTHDCGTRDNKSRCPVPVDETTLRKMRHKTGHKECDGSLVKCNRCQTTLTAEQMVLNVLNAPEGNGGPGRIHTEFPDKTTHSLGPATMHHHMNFCWTQGTQSEQARRLFHFNAKYNLHRTRHSVRCFKGGRCECFANLPKPPVVKITYAPSVGNPVAWFDSFGNEESFTLFAVEQERSISDAFVNTHSKLTTLLLGCNNNVSCALSGRSVIYATCYTGKNTQKDDRYAYERVCEAIVRQLRRQEDQENRDPNEAAERDYGMGLRRLLVGIMAHTQAHIVSAPMARHIVMNEDRFTYSHTFRKIPLDGIRGLLFGEPVRMFMRQYGGKQVKFTYALNYTLRPAAMEGMSVYKYFATTTTMGRKAAEKLEYFDYQEEHPLYGLEVVVYGETVWGPGKQNVPSFSFAFLPDAKNLGGSILKPWDRKKRRRSGAPIASAKSKTKECQQLSEAYALRFLVLFYPARTAEDLQRDGSALNQLDYSLSNGLISEDSLRIANNIQNIHNSLRAGVPEDGLAARTTEFDGYVSRPPLNFSNPLYNTNHTLFPPVPGTLTKQRNRMAEPKASRHWKQ
jgi:hypothetical protein